MKNTVCNARPRERWERASSVIEHRADIRNCLAAGVGSIVRVAPNEVSFNSPQSWNDIYGFRQGHQTFLKSDFYEGGPFAGRGVHSIVSERDVDAHAQMRRHLAHAFSDRSLSEQEALVAETVDKFVRVVGDRGQQKGGLNISKALEMMTFDIIGDLAFGETFGGVDSGECPCINSDIWNHPRRGLRETAACGRNLSHWEENKRSIEWQTRSRLLTPFGANRSSPSLDFHCHGCSAAGRACRHTEAVPSRRHSAHNPHSRETSDTNGAD